MISLLRRYVTLALLVLFVAQSSGVALADAGRPAGASFNVTELMASMRALIATLGASSGRTPPLIRHTPLPLRSAPDYADPKRFTRLIRKPREAAKTVIAARPIDLVKVRRERRAESTNLEHTGLSMRGQARSHARPLATLPTPTTGIVPWWTYEARSIPGVGHAMVNVGNYNFLIEENDVDVPEGGLDLAFRRMYNSRSQHDANGDDGSTPSVYGNRWTNNLDVHLGWTQGSGNSGTVSVYTGDGAREDYTCETDSVTTCTPPPGVYDLLAPTQLGGNGIACQFQWTKKSGTTYIFDAPYSQCTSNDAGYYGRLLTIYGRNQNFYITLAYSWTNHDDTNPENIAQITVTHQPDGAQLIFSFGTIAGTSITELLSLTRPDGENIYYHYSSNGDLDELDKPGNSPVPFNNENPPAEYADGTAIAPGNLPETYAITPGKNIEICGPRAAISIIDTKGNPDDGSCVDLDYSNGQLSDWYTRGRLNTTPEDNVSPSSIQSGPSTGFVQWNDTMFIQFTNCNGAGGNATYLTDAYDHAVFWCYDTSDRVYETQVYNGGPWLTMLQSWDSNNNLTSTTDARNFTTNMGYDSNGNTVEVSLPKQTVQVGSGTSSMTPTNFYDYDQYNNVIRYCDPANNGNNTFQTPTDSLCKTWGTNPAVYTLTKSDSNEPYGCITQIATPSGYDRTISYVTVGSSCGNGLPLEVVGQTIHQYDSESDTRTPTQLFTYYSNGTLRTYDGGNGPWQITYTSNGMNRLRSRADPDGVTSYWCYNLDGSTFYSETANQNQMDQSPACPTNAKLISGATPPLYAVSYGYDADGDVVTDERHHNCITTNCAANNAAATNCYMMSVASGTTCKFYDGLDRLVEVKQPWDGNFDLYTNPSITRYLYDLTDGQYSFGGAQFSAHGNLFETEELLPSSTGSQTGIVGGTWGGGGPTRIANTQYQVLKATAYDWLDRPVAKYSFAWSGQAEQLNTETMTWDTSPLDPTVTGMLGQDCNSLRACQQFDYTPDGQKLTAKSSDNSFPRRDYTYDADGRAAVIQSAAYSSSQQYTYNIDGELSTSTDPSGGNAVTSPATITHRYYADGTESAVDVSSSALTQSNLFEYAYRQDGLLANEQINHTSLQGSPTLFGKTLLTYTLTAAGRMTKRVESGVGKYSHNTTESYDSTTGLKTSESTPVGSLSQLTYFANTELMMLFFPATRGPCTMDILPR